MCQYTSTIWERESSVSRTSIYQANRIGLQVGYTAKSKSIKLGTNTPQISRLEVAT